MTNRIGVSSLARNAADRRAFLTRLGFASTGLAVAGFSGGGRTSMMAQSRSSAKHRKQIFTAALIVEEVAITFCYNGLIATGVSWRDRSECFGQRARGQRRLLSRGTATRKRSHDTAAVADWTTSFGRPGRAVLFSQRHFFQLGQFFRDTGCVGERIHRGEYDRGRRWV